jgi:hypothetical protein
VTAGGVETVPTILGTSAGWGSAFAAHIRGGTGWAVSPAGTDGNYYSKHRSEHCLVIHGFLLRLVLLPNSLPVGASKASIQASLALERLVRAYQVKATYAYHPRYRGVKSFFGLLSVGLLSIFRDGRDFGGVTQKGQNC